MPLSGIMKVMQKEKLRSPVAISRLTGINQTNISRWLSGRMMPSRKNLLRLAKATGEDPEQLMLDLYRKKVARESKKTSQNPPTP